MAVLNVIIALLIISVFFLIRAEFQSNRKQIYIFKPISTILVITVVIFALLSGNQMSSVYSLWILAALLFSFGGDLALMFQENPKAFRIGLVLFLIAHIVYALSFYKFSGGIAAPAGIIIILAIISAAGYTYLYPQLGSMKIAVLAYILIISYMLNRAIATHFGVNFSNQQAWQISIGAGLFYLSDFMLAINRFKKSFKYSRISLAFYYSGQLLIALSAVSL